MASVRILLVDDDPEGRALVLRELRRSYPAAEFVEIAGGAQLADALDGPTAHLVITDDDLGWTDGLAILRQVKQRWEWTPVIMITGAGNEQVAAECIALGLDDYVVMSPEHAERLGSSVARALRHVDDLQALSAATERYRMLFERVPVGLYRYDPGGTLIECNQALLDIFVASDVDSLRAAGFPRELYVDQADRDRWRGAIAGGVATGIEYRVRRLNGDVAWVRHSAKLVRSPIGDPMWFEGVIEDVTQSRAAQQALIEAEGRYRDVFENVPIGLYRSAPDGRHIDANPAMVQILGFETVKDYLASNANDLYLEPEDRRLWRETLERDGVVRGFEVRLRRPDGRVIWVRDSATAVPDESGAVVMYDGNIEDITERKETEDDLRKTLHQLHRLNDERQRLLGRLVAAQEDERQRLAGDIHDDPIQVMAAAAVRLDMVERATIGTPAQETLERTAETVQQAINRLRNLVFELRPPALDREGLAAAIHQYLEQLADAEIDVALQNELAREPAREIRTAAYRIVQEALTNVRKHAGATSVRVELRRQDGGITTVVADDGVGFHAGADPSRPRPGHIGLQSMRERAEALGGWWRIESRPQGGTRMEFWLPDEAGDADARDE